jgi:hypothetical protein
MAATPAYSRPVSRLPRRARRSPRVYYIVAATIALSLAPRAPGAEVRLSIAPAMSKGAPAAPVTIVEFSDYQ